jgi:hypothetical protein
LAKLLSEVLLKLIPVYLIQFDFATPSSACGALPLHPARGKLRLLWGLGQSPIQHDSSIYIDQKFIIPLKSTTKVSPFTQGMLHMEKEFSFDGSSSKFASFFVFFFFRSTPSRQEWSKSFSFVLNA